MKEPVLIAVGMPPRVFWAPMYPAIVNFAIQAGILFVCITAFDISPLYFIVTIGLAHILIAAYSFKEPHLSKMMLTYGPMATPSKNIYPDKGNKLAPYGT